jgi:hypothetical protein
MEDSATGVLIDVLANDWVSPWAGATKQLFSAGVLTEQGSVMIVGDRLNFVPAKDFSGTAILRYTLRDATPGASPTASGDGTITVTVTPVNDAPRFTKGADLEVTDESGEQTITGWAMQIAAGPADEADQTLEFFVEASDTSLLTVQPRLNAAGTLTFTPAPNAGGVAEVIVRLKDNGGRASGGQDESEPQTFSIHIVMEHTLHNTEMPLDSSGDGGISSVDALNVINYINAFGAGPVDGRGEGEGSSSLLYVDTNADGHVSASDALDVINYINAFGPKQPAISGSGGEGELASLLDMLAADAAAQAAAGRRKL